MEDYRFPKFKQLLIIIINCNIIIYYNMYNILNVLFIYSN